MLVGSAAHAPGATAHSGAGGIGRLRMRPMSLSERGTCEPANLGADLLDIIINAAPNAYRRPDGIGVVPPACNIVLTDEAISPHWPRCRM